MDQALVRRVIPAILIAGLAGSNGIFFLQDMNAREARDAALRDRDAAHQTVENAVSGERSKVDAARRELDEARRQLAAAEERVKIAQGSGASDVQRVIADRDAARSKAQALEARVGALEAEGAEARKRAAALEAEREDARKKAAALADRLGEVEGERDKLKKHAEELDDLMSRLAAKKLNARRLAGLEGPPREEVEVVSLDERRTPPALVLRAETLEGLEEGDPLYVVRTTDGKAREVGRVLVDKVDKGRGLLSATVAKLAAGEKISVGEKLTTYAP